MEKDLITNNFKNEIEIILTTNLSEEYVIANNRIPVPSNYDQESLNKLVKRLLKMNLDKNFVFFINDILVDSNIADFININNIPYQKVTETGLEIVYSFETEEPKLINTIKEDEWIKKIGIRLNQRFDDSIVEFYSVGLFNSEVTIYNNKFEKIIDIKENNSSSQEQNYCELLHDLLFFNTSDNLRENYLIKSSRNEDCTFQIYSVNLLEMNHDLIYQGRKEDSEYSNCLALNPVDFNYFASGNSDGTIRIFKIPEKLEKLESNIDVVNKKKKRRLDAQVLESENKIENSHGGNEVKLIKWINNQQLLTSGDDFFIKLWNIHTQTNYSTFNTNYKMTTSLCSILPGNEKFLSGHEDGSLRLWDIRQNNNKIVFQNAHRNLISDIMINPNVNEYSNNFSTVGYDGLLKVWDMRSIRKALYEIKTDSEKNYTLAYNSSNYLMTGGDNSTINIYESK